MLNTPFRDTARPASHVGVVIVASLLINACTGADTPPKAQPTPTVTAAVSSNPEASTRQTPTTAAKVSKSAPASATAAPAGWTSVWNEDFVGPAGSSPDATKWTYDLGGQGWGNSELQNYTDRPSNVSLDGRGNLVITARRENEGYCWYGDCTHTSARLLTKDLFTQKYGRIEARVRLPEGQGLWPAFWMLGDDLTSAGWPAAGEIDITEVLGHETNKTYGTLHGPGYSGADGIGTAYTLPAGQSFSSDFHVFAIDWAPNEIKWSVDGVLFSTKTPADLDGDKWVFDHPFFIIVNLAVGGNWPGSPDDATRFPAEYVIDYVRTYRAN